jgi:hypothetical protein
VRARLSSRFAVEFQARRVRLASIPANVEPDQGLGRMPRAQADASEGYKSSQVHPLRRSRRAIVRLKAEATRRPHEYGRRAGATANIQKSSGAYNERGPWLISHSSEPLPYPPAMSTKQRSRARHHRVSPGLLIASLRLVSSTRLRSPLSGAVAT